MRTPVIACFSFFAVFALATACAKSDPPDVDAIIHDRNGTDPADAGGAPAGDDDTETAPIPRKPVPAVDAGHVDAGGDAGDGGKPKPAGDDDDDTGTECDPNNAKYQAEVLLAASQGGATSCANGPDDCAKTECCYVNIISASANLCIAK